MTTFKLSLNSQLEQKLKSISQLTNKSEQQLIIEALEKHLQELSQPQNCYELATQLGVIGIAENLPTDLSTNKDYFQGFGQ